MPRLPFSTVTPEGFFLAFSRAAKGAALRGEVSFFAGGGVNRDPCNGDLGKYPLGVSNFVVVLGLQEPPRVLFSASPHWVNPTSHRRLVSRVGLWEGSAQADQQRLREA